mmetsp:Transcript_1087/g.3089  ORF Transcript_1087/g.3089 Transcript_1087/m.3089 type:complete len:211 (-) Transcript_1087:123-755(-)
MLDWSVRSLLTWSVTLWKFRRSRSTILFSALLFNVASSYTDFSPLMLSPMRSSCFMLLWMPRSRFLKTGFMIAFRSLRSRSICSRSASFSQELWLRPAIVFSSRFSSCRTSNTLRCTASDWALCCSMSRFRFRSNSDSALSSSLSSRKRRRCSSSSLRVVLSMSECIRARWSIMYDCIEPPPIVAPPTKFCVWKLEVSSELCSRPREDGT